MRKTVHVIILVGNMVLILLYLNIRYTVYGIFYYNIMNYQLY